jgi:hypothetical protein
VYQKNVASQGFGFAMVTTSGAADASATVSVFVSKAGAAQASGAGSITNLGNGQYWYTMTQAETNTNFASFMMTASGDVPVEKTLLFTAANPTNGTNYGLGAIPNVATGNPGALLVDGTGTAAISNSGGKVLLQATQTGVTIPAVTTVTTVTGDVQGKVLGGGASVISAVGVQSDMRQIRGTNSVGQAGSVGIDWAQVANKTTFNNLSATSIGSVVTVTGNVNGSVIGMSGNIQGVGVRADVWQFQGSDSAGVPGYVGIDWSNVINAGASVDMSMTTVALTAGAVNQMTIADSALTDAKFTVPTEITGQPTGILSMIFALCRRVFLRRRVKDKVSGIITTYLGDNTTVAMQETYISNASVDDIGGAM